MPLRDTPITPDAARSLMHPQESIANSAPRRAERRQTTNSPLSLRAAEGAGGRRAFLLLTTDSCLLTTPPQNTAIGFTVEPVTVGSRNGLIVIRNSQRLRAAHASERSSSQALSRIQSPSATIPTW